jgi:Tol biopolymer transport system component
MGPSLATRLSGDRPTRVLLIAACLGSITCRSTPPSPASPPASGHGHPVGQVGLIPLARYEVRYDGTRFFFTGLDDDGRRLGGTEAGPGPGDPAVQPLIIEPVDAATENTDGGGVPAPNWVLVKQMAIRSLDGDCNTLAAAEGDVIPSPFQGICAPIETRSGFASDELIRTHVEVDGKTDTVGTSTLLVNAGSDAGFGTNGMYGVWNHGRMAEAGVTDVSGNRLDHSRRVWYFQTSVPGAQAQFNYHFMVKGELVRALRQPNLPCTPATNFPIRPSGDGRYLVYMAYDIACGGGQSQIYRYDLQTGANVLVSHAAGQPSVPANGLSEWASISADGRWVAFQSGSTDLLPGGTDIDGYVDSNIYDDVFVRDMETGVLRLVSVDDNTMATPPLGNPGEPVISDDGKFVVFHSPAQIDFNGADTNNVGDVYRRDIGNRITQLVSQTTLTRSAQARKASVSSGGGAVAFESTDRAFHGGSGVGQSEVYVRSFDGTARFTGLRRVSVTGAGAEADGAARNADLSDDGRVVAFESVATNMLGPATTAGRSHIYVRRADATGSLVRADFQAAADGTLIESNGHSQRPSLSAEGRMVTFGSTATNLDPLVSNNFGAAYMYDVNPVLLQPVPGVQDVKRRRNFLLSVRRDNVALGGGGIVEGGVYTSADGRYAVFTGFGVAPLR